MKVWKRDHPRITRGKRIHKTVDERGKELHEKAAGKRKKLTRRAVEVKPELVSEATVRYLMPDVENFVETDQVKAVKDKVKLWIETGYPVHIIGPTGCGKSTLAMKVSEEFERPMVWINGDESLTTEDLVGGYTGIERESVRDRFIWRVPKAYDMEKANWVDNPLTIACKGGYTFVYNDFSRSQPAANNVLLSVFEEGILELPGKLGEERYVKIHPDFTPIMTSNSVDYAGVHRPQDALLDRMVGVYMDFYEAPTEVEIVKKHTGISTSEAERIVKAVRNLRERLPDVEKPGTRACIMIAKALTTISKGTDEMLEEMCVDILATKVRGPIDLVEKEGLVKEAIGEMETSL